jgi:hypothetical protein
MKIRLFNSIRDGVPNGTSCKISLLLLVMAIHCGAQQLNLVVTSNPLWTDTGLSLVNGQIVSFSASGTWNADSNRPWLASDPGGEPGTAWSTPELFYGPGNVGELIGYVGADPLQGHWPSGGSFFPQATNYWAIGTGGQFTSDSSGELWLGFNDDAYSGPAGVTDNEGSVNVSLTVVPEPSSMLLAIFGGLLLAKSFQQYRAGTKLSFSLTGK